MKNPFPALLLATTVAALASDPPIVRQGDLLATGFENFEASTAVVGHGDDGAASASSPWSADGDDDSYVAEYASGAAPAPVAFPTPYKDAGSKYLCVEAGGELRRAVTSPTTAGTTYIDALVQFPTTAEAPDVSGIQDAKFLLWLQDSGDGTTNLCAKAGNYGWDGDGVFVREAVYVLALAGGSPAPGSWHRVTVTSYASAPEAAAADLTLPGFSVRVDGVQATIANAVVSHEGQHFAAGGVASDAVIEYFGELSEDLGALVGEGGAFLPALGGLASSRGTVTQLAFRGSGAIDDLVVTSEEPSFTASTAVYFTLAWPQDATAVSYEFDDGEGGTETIALANVSAGSATVELEPGTEVTLRGTLGGNGASEATGTVVAGGTLELTGPDATWFFPTTATADQDGSAEHPFEIATPNDLWRLEELVRLVPSSRSLHYVQVADIALDAAWPGIGIQNGKDICTTAEFDNGAFSGTYDGGNFTISNFQMVDGLDYCGLFNSVYGATIKNLKVSYKDGSFAKDMVAANEACGATFVGVAKNSTLQNLTSLAGTVSCTKGFGGIVGYLMAGATVDSCTNNVNLTSTASNKAGGIAMITQNGSGKAIIRNCQNNGTTAGNANQKGGIVGYVGVATTIDGCTDTAGSAPSILHNQGQTITIQGVNKAPANVASYTTSNNNPIDGLDFALVDGNVATFVKNADLAAGNTYKVMGPKANATYELAAEGDTISFETSLATPTYAITAGSGLKAVPETSGTVTTYTAAALATVNVMVTGGANATAAWTVNGASVASAPATLTEGDTYSVTYTADEGYAFAAGATTSAEGTVGTEDIAIAIDDAAPASVEPEYVGPKEGGLRILDAVLDAAAYDGTITPLEFTDIQVTGSQVVATFDATVDIDDPAQLTATFGIVAESPLGTPYAGTLTGTVAAKADGTGGTVTISLPAGVDALFLKGLRNVPTTNDAGND